MARMTYWGHSGFSVDTGVRTLIFDYIGGGMPDPAASDRAIFFISHAHRDHCSHAALAICKRASARLVTSADMANGSGLALAPGDEATLDGARIRAFDSTDEGVSFLIEADGLNIFHAGDLNLWHWADESTDQEIRAAHDAFESALAPLIGARIDVALFPVDPRMGTDYDAGALRFADALRPALIIPMHFWDDPTAAEAFVLKPMPGGVRAAALTAPGQYIDFQQGGV